MRISKYHGLGNDFLVIDAREAPQEGGEAARHAWAARLCDRHRGVGGDGVLVVEEEASGADARMIIYNADGSRPEMCGNGIRCFVLHLERTRGPQASWTIATDAGPRRCVPSREGDAWRASVEMGPASWSPAVEVEALGRRFTLHPASMGNPHAVLRAGEGDDLDAEARALGLALSRHPAFPEGANVEWTRPRGDGSLEVVVFERGVGVTLACGTGACAAAAVARRLGWIAPTPRTAVDLPGGRLWIEHGEQLTMLGPAAFVFDATLPTP
jgi:diaminopimelate epimerase